MAFSKDFYWGAATAAFQIEGGGVWHYEDHIGHYDVDTSLPLYHRLYVA